ncbi:glutamine-hydrolyzing carbamoyl-phosphate synthase small subunit [Halocola ammonii]
MNEKHHHTPAVLVLQDGTVFNGYAAGAIGTTTGEIAFNTGMTGYQEIFTDPSYYRQVLVMATAHIGNYGVHTDEIESDSIKIAGLVTKNYSAIFSRASGECSLNDYFLRDGVVAICNVDTRALVRHIRQKGAMNCIISSETTDIDKLKDQLKETPSMEGLELSSKVTCKEAYEFGDPAAKYRVAAFDYGTKTNILRMVAERDAFVKVFPMKATTEEVKAWNPDGIMFSNGPGDPASMADEIKVVGELIDSGIPCFGICLGHQLMSLSQGLKTEKMFNGHRGINHPIKNLETGKCEITSQNHGFVVSKSSAEDSDKVEITHEHLNDHSVAGIKVKGKNAFSVQYHPEAAAGPHDSRYLFDQFIEMIASQTKEKVS